jgi:hypothetical protein
METQLQDYENRKFMIFNVSELDLIDFNHVGETYGDTVRKSINGTKTFVKWDSIEIPSSVVSLTTSEGPYTYDEIIIILNSPEWTEERTM